MNQSRGQAVGIDIGGTKMAVGAVAADGRIVARAECPTAPRRGFDAGVTDLVALIDGVLGQAGWRGAPLAGIGIGCPGPLDPGRGIIANDFTLPSWGGRNITAPLAARYGVAAWLENDGDAAVMGEAFAGAARDCASAVMLTFGTGIGAGILIGGEVYRGRNGQHPELGHIPVESGDGPSCYCGRAGCFESVASGTAIGAAGLGGGREVFAAWERGDAAASAVVARALRACQAAAWTIAHTFLPERIVLGGGVMDARFDLFADAMRQCLETATQFEGTVAVVRAELGQAAGLVGAARIAFQRQGAATT